MSIYRHILQSLAIITKKSLTMHITAHCKFNIRDDKILVTAMATDAHTALKGALPLKLNELTIADMRKVA